MKKRNKIKVVTIGGGSGQYTLLFGLRDIKNIEITSIVSMVDSGGSTGRLRDELGILPPGDILKCILALSPYREAARKIFQTRFEFDERLRGHNAGNMLLSMLAQYAGSFPQGINALGEILAIQGKVLPVTTDKATLAAELTSGEFLYGETTIDIPRGDKREKIKRTFLVPHHSDAIKAYPPVAEAIKEAEYIIIGPGDLYTSILPNFLVPGVAEAVKKAKGKIIYIVNIMTKFGETDNFSASDFIRIVEEKIRRKIDFVFFNKTGASAGLLKKYNKQKAELVKLGRLNKEQMKKTIQEDLLSSKGGIIRHDAKKLAAAIMKILL
jgi:uncharacterized cofD-like protein